MGGIRYLTGEPDRPPSRIGISLGDSLTATFAAMGAVLALQARHRTGRGQVVDSAIYESVLALMESVLPEWELAGYQLTGPRHWGPSRCLRCWPSTGCLPAVFTSPRTCSATRTSLRATPSSG